MKVYLTAGHQVINGKGTGAISNYGDEAVEALKIRDALAARLISRGIHVEMEKPSDPLTNVINWLRSKVTGKDICIDIHFNSAASDKATGTEVIIPEKYTKTELELAKKFVSAMTGALGTKARVGKMIHHGVKTESETAHGTIGILNKPASANNILLEVCFISNYDDYKSYYKNFNSLINNVADVIENATV